MVLSGVVLPGVVYSYRSLLEQVATVFFIHDSSVQQVGDILGLLVQDGLSGPVTLDGLEPLGSLHLPGNDECPCLQPHSCPADETAAETLASHAVGIASCMPMMILLMRLSMDLQA